MPTSPMSRPLLVGEDNPYGIDAYFALYPAPDGCAGHRLCCLILGMRRKDYLRSFCRANLCAGTWSADDARTRAQELVAAVPTRNVILLGAKVCRAFAVPFRPFTVALDGAALILPHPSGRCRLWSEPGAFQKARGAVAAFLPDLAHLIGAPL